MVDFVPSNSSIILDAGCGEGEFGRLLKDRNDIIMWGIEKEPDIASIASKVYDRIIVGDILEKVQTLPDNYFDCIIFNDVLEMFVNPNIVLDYTKNKLKPDGSIVASIPNVRYYKVLFDLLIMKKWEYQFEGVLDQTHLRFFTKSTINKLMEDNGFEVINIQGINASKFIPLKILNILTLGLFNDVKYLQFACVAKPK